MGVQYAHRDGPLVLASNILKVIVPSPFQLLGEGHGLQVTTKELIFDVLLGEPEFRKSGTSR